ncbi:hypothetical protein J0S82_017223 [Galemys pyrenaicus]|uniref:Uncharacterized protein n=1 Tax=Galemys pyrenaicus TaxID=202257 RepID=A0A8J6AG57_GALPY|nr:hypothetical protein J0S82_017223 [Galemys pyrenaicus]
MGTKGTGFWGAGALISHLLCTRHHGDFLYANAEPTRRLRLALAGGAGIGWTTGEASIRPTGADLFDFLKTVININMMMEEFHILYASFSPVLLVFEIRNTEDLTEEWLREKLGFFH